MRPFVSACLMLLLLGAVAPTQAKGPLDDFAMAWFGQFTWDGDPTAQAYEVTFTQVQEADAEGWGTAFGVARNYASGRSQPTVVDWEAFIHQDGRIEIYEHLVRADNPAYTTDGMFAGRLSQDGCTITARWTDTPTGMEGDLLLRAIGRPNCP